MPKKNSIINNTPPQEKILIEDAEPQTQTEVTKPKRQISDAQREHLNNIRSKALEKKAQMKEETLKAKLAQTLEKKELVKKEGLKSYNINLKLLKNRLMILKRHKTELKKLL